MSLPVGMANLGVYAVFLVGSSMCFIIDLLRSLAGGWLMLDLLSRIIESYLLWNSDVSPASTGCRCCFHLGNVLLSVMICFPGGSADF